MALRILLSLVFVFAILSSAAFANNNRHSNNGYNNGGQHHHHHRPPAYYPRPPVYYPPAYWGPRPGYYPGWNYNYYTWQPRWYYPGYVFPNWSWYGNIPQGYWQCTSFNGFGGAFYGIGQNSQIAAYNALNICGGAYYQNAGCYIPPGYCQFRY